jgi:hypothetical protein
VWGFSNFLHLCDVAVILTCAGLWSGSALLGPPDQKKSIRPSAPWKDFVFAPENASKALLEDPSTTAVHIRAKRFIMKPPAKPGLPVALGRGRLTDQDNAQPKVSW